MKSRTGRPALRRGEDLAGLARRVVALGIAVGAPVIAITWFRDGPHDPWVRWGIHALSLAAAKPAAVRVRSRAGGASL